MAILRSSSTGALPASPSHHSNNHRTKTDHLKTTRTREIRTICKCQKADKEARIPRARRATSVRSFGGSPKKAPKKARPKAGVYLSGVVSPDGDLASSFLNASSRLSLNAASEFSLATTRLRRKPASGSHTSGQRLRPWTKLFCSARCSFPLSLTPMAATSMRSRLRSESSLLHRSLGKNRSHPSAGPSSSPGRA